LISIMVSSLYDMGSSSDRDPRGRSEQERLSNRSLSPWLGPTRDPGPDSK
jgi:hypothetical protein